MKDCINDCETCQNFVQHYVVNKELGIFKAHCGHCKSFRTLKSNCAAYIEGENNTYRDKVVHLATFLIKLNKNIEILQKEVNRLYSIELKDIKK